MAQLALATTTLCQSALITLLVIPFHLVMMSSRFNLSALASAQTTLRRIFTVTISTELPPITSSGSESKSRESSTNMAQLRLLSPSTRTSSPISPACTLTRLAQLLVAMPLRQLAGALKVVKTTGFASTLGMILGVTRALSRSGWEKPASTTKCTPDSPLALTEHLNSSKLSKSMSY